MGELKELFLQACQNVSSTNWKKCAEHVVKEELDGTIENLLEPFVISVGAKSDTSTWWLEYFNYIIYKILLYKLFILFVKQFA